METSTVKNQIIENVNNKNKPDYVPHSIIITTEIINDIFNAENCTVLKSPKYPHEESNITFYRNDNPERILVAHLNLFCVNPKDSFPKSGSKLFKSSTSSTEPSLTQEEKLDKQL